MIPKQKFEKGRGINVLIAHSKYIRKKKKKMLCIHATPISGSLTLNNASSSQMNIVYLAVLEFYCNQSQYDAYVYKIQQKRKCSYFGIARCMNAFRDLRSDSNKINSFLHNSEHSKYAAPVIRVN